VLSLGWLRYSYSSSGSGLGARRCPGDAWAGKWYSWNDATALWTCGSGLGSSGGLGGLCRRRQCSGDIWLRIDRWWGPLLRRGWCGSRRIWLGSCFCRGRFCYTIRFCHLGLRIRLLGFVHRWPTWCSPLRTRWRLILTLVLLAGRPNGHWRPEGTRWLVEALWPRRKPSWRRGPVGTTRRHAESRPAWIGTGASRTSRETTLWSKAVGIRWRPEVGGHPSGWELALLLRREVGVLGRRTLLSLGALGALLRLLHLLDPIGQVSNRSLIDIIEE
jgi:hypothetical protein